MKKHPENKSFQMTLTLNASVETVFEKLLNIPMWWTQSYEGSCKQEGAEFTIYFGSSVYKTMQVELLIPQQKTVWKVVDALINFPELTEQREWIDTRIVWEISQLHDQTLLNLVHEGLNPKFECYELCQAGWHDFLKSLSLWIQTDAGTPFVPSSLKIALASAPIPHSLKEGLANLEPLMKDAAAQGAELICFPESYFPGYPGMGYQPEDQSEAALTAALEVACKTARQYRIALILPMDWHSAVGLQNVVFVISPAGSILGYQTKNQLDPSEDQIWVPGTERYLFEVKGVKIGVSICHEGFRYPETVRWAARRGAKVVFHPHFSGGGEGAKQLSEWGSMENPYYEKAMMMRSVENTIYFASVNYNSQFTESASSVINPDGTCKVFQPYGQAGVLVTDLDLDKATGALAKRFKPEILSYD